MTDVILTNVQSAEEIMLPVSMVNKKLTNYGTQLREKQKVRRYYGVLEGQFTEYYNIAEKMSGKPVIIY